MINLTGGVLSTFQEAGGPVIVATLAVLVVTLALWTLVRPNGFPPGPRGLPIVGSMFDMTESPEIIFSRWAEQYGDIFGLKVGQRWMVVLTGHEVIREALIKQGADFAGRADFYSTEIISEGYQDIAFSNYSEAWKLHRKLAHTALRHFATGDPLQKLVSSVYPKVQKELEKTGVEPVDPDRLFTLLVYNIISQMCFGKSYELCDPKICNFMDMRKRLEKDIGLGLAADFFPRARYLPTSGPKMIAQEIEKVFKILRDEIKEAEERYDPDKIDNMCSLLRKAQEDAKRDGENVDQLSDVRIFQTLHNIFQGGISTSMISLYWATALLCEYPDVQVRAQAEIDRVIGRDRLPTIEDRGNLTYTEATLLEVLRFSSIGPVSMPHTTLQDVDIHGYVIPKGTIVMANLFSMHFDPKEWEKPEEFRPEHFLDENGKVRQSPRSFLPFSAGRRVCLGEAVAKAELFLIFTWFLQNYIFSKVPGKEDESLIRLIPKTVTGRILQPYEIIITKREKSTR